MAVSRRPLVTAHTGCGVAPGNTIESFLEGVHAGAEIIEIDLRIAKDRTVILLHDDSPLLLEYTYDELNQIPVRTQLGRHYDALNIAKLTDILDMLDRFDVQLNLDIKHQSVIDPAIALIHHYNAQNRVFITGESERIAARYPDIRVLYNTPDVLGKKEMGDYDSFIREICGIARDGSYYGLNMNYTTCSEQAVQTAHASGLKVWIYTVDEPDAFKTFIQMGVDAITTNKVSALIEIRD